MHRIRALSLSIGLLTLGWGSAPAAAGGRITGPRLGTEPPPKTVTVVLVLDRSGSMTGLKMATTRKACQRLVRHLRPTDRIGVVAFDTRPRQILAVQRVGQGRAAVAAIGSVKATGGTHYLAALTMADRMLTRATRVAGERRHVIFLSDGQAPRAGVVARIRAMRRGGVTLSTVAISPHADRAFLAQMAREGRGRAHYVPHISTLLQMLRKELASLGR